MNNYKTYYENLILDGMCNFESYDKVMTDSDLENINTVYDIFEEEMGWTLEALPVKEAFSDWIQNLPHVLVVPRDYKDIKEEYKENYYENLAEAFFTLKENL